MMFVYNINVSEIEWKRMEKGAKNMKKKKKKREKKNLKKKKSVRTEKNKSEIETTHE